MLRNPPVWLNHGPKIAALQRFLIELRFSPVAFAPKSNTDPCGSALFFGGGGENRASQTMTILLAFHASQSARLTQPRPENRCTAAISNRASILSCRIRAKKQYRPLRVCIAFLVELTHPNANIFVFLGGFEMIVLL